jgi:hypothetical protein
MRVRIGEMRVAKDPTKERVYVILAVEKTVGDTNLMVVWDSRGWSHFESDKYLERWTVPVEQLQSRDDLSRTV